jgi:hypothetical protein
MNLSQILLVVAIVLFVIAAIYEPSSRPNWPRVWIGWLGMAFFAASFLVT